MNSLAARLAALNLATVVMNVGASSAILAFLGPQLADALYAAAAVPWALTSAWIASVVEPRLADMNGKSDEALRPYLRSSIMKSLALFGIVATGMALLIPLLANVFGSAARSNVSLFTYLVVAHGIAMVLAAPRELMRVALYSRHEFTYVECSVAVSTAAFLCVVVLGSALQNPVLSAVGFAVRQGCDVLLFWRKLAPCVRQSTRCSVGEDSVYRRWKCGLKLTGANLLQRSDFVLERTLAAQASVGSISAYSFVSQVFSATNRLLTVALINPVLPHLVKLARESQYTACLAALRRVRATLLFLLAAGFLLCVVVQQIWSGTLNGVHGTDVQRVLSVSVMAYGLLAGAVLAQLSTSALYSIDHSETAARILVVTCIAGGIIKFGLFSIAGFPGLCLSVSAFWILHSIALQRAVGTKMNREIA